MDENQLLLKRFRDLADQCYRSGIYTFTGFLSMAELSSFYEISRELSYVPWKVFGGSGLCERAMIRFGGPEQLGYEEEFPIVCLKISPLLQKFADALSHRDFLGALMNLGIERSTLGDIIIQENQGFLFCTGTIAPFIIENLTKIKHTSVLCRETQELPAVSKEDLKEMTVQLSSERIDGAISKVYRLSRSESIELFRQKRVFLDGRLCENNSASLKEESVVTVRGYGKFIFVGLSGVSRKGKLNAVIRYYGQA